MSSQSRRALGRDRNKVLTRKDHSDRLGQEGERTSDEGTETSPLTFTLPFYDDCVLCWVRFEHGFYVSGCRCVEHQVNAD